MSQNKMKAEEMLAEIEQLFKKEELTEADLIAARTLKNKLEQSAFDEDGDKKRLWIIARQRRAI